MQEEQEEEEEEDIYAKQNLSSKLKILSAGRRICRLHPVPVHDDKKKNSHRVDFTIQVDQKGIK